MCMGFAFFRSGTEGMKEFQRMFQAIIRETGDDQVMLLQAYPGLSITDPSFYVGGGQPGGQTAASCCVTEECTQCVHGRPRTARKTDVGTLCLLSCSWMIAPVR